ncbi:MAG: nucleotidyltransferase [Planctomycetes bacterium]|nr:nucleotidyltransferase [Planctomycetota bacterium]MBI3847199.1 nucleotidyltransferase [Planctomycetota bacterium]
MQDSEGLLARLTRGRVEFVVIGGFAAIAHGSTILTRDLDICCSLDPDNLMRLQAALADVHPTHRTTRIRPPLHLTPESARTWKNLYLETSIGQIDCLGNVEGIGSYEQVKARSIELNLPAGSCHVLDLDALIESKEAIGHEKDREAILQLKAIRERLR